MDEPGARSSMGVLGDLNRYQQYQLGASIPTAAANPAGGLAVLFAPPPPPTAW